MDRHNAALAANVHPRDWLNPERRGRDLGVDVFLEEARFSGPDTRGI